MQAWDMISTIRQWTNDDVTDHIEENEDIMSDLMRIFEDYYRDTECGLHKIDDILDKLKCDEYMETYLLIRRHMDSED